MPGQPLFVLMMTYQHSLFTFVILDSFISKRILLWSLLSTTADVRAPSKHQSDMQCTFFVRQRCSGLLPRFQREEKLCPLSSLQSERNNQRTTDTGIQSPTITIDTNNDSKETQPCSVRGTNQTESHHVPADAGVSSLVFLALLFSSSLPFLHRSHSDMHICSLLAYIADKNAVKCSQDAGNGGPTRWQPNATCRFRGLFGPIGFIFSIQGFI